MELTGIVEAAPAASLFLTTGYTLTERTPGLVRSR
jgi:hypothetical protein